MQLPGTCNMQGAEVSFTIQAGQGASVPSDAKLQVYTTRPDTLFGVTYMVLAPEHPLLPHLTTPAQQQEVDAYVTAAGRMSELERTELQKSKTGVFTGQATAPPPPLSPHNPRSSLLGLLQT